MYGGRQRAWQAAGGGPWSLHLRADGTHPPALRLRLPPPQAGAMFNCYTTTGSFSRSAVNDSVGWVGRQGADPRLLRGWGRGAAAAAHFSRALALPTAHPAPPLPLPCLPPRSAKTPLANFVTGLVVMLVLLVLTSVFTHMSSNVQVPGCCWPRRLRRDWAAAHAGFEAAVGQRWGAGGGQAMREP